jgi:hypothetical protein
VRTLSLITEGSCWALVAEGACEEGVCRQATRLVAVDGRSQTVEEAVEDLLVRTEEEVQLPPGVGRVLLERYSGTPGLVATLMREEQPAARTGKGVS